MKDNSNSIEQSEWLYGSAHLTFRTQPLGPEFGSGIEGQEFFLTLGNFPEPGIFP